ncbi:MAG: LysM peptidoglycan-binding domain-containing protein [Spirochaetaceae bacterium]|jgi:LysM repeat protein|nr:LysM peptidoglycan-binding domain-containing protein [Spirochaetaceae bacterium]
MSSITVFNSRHYTSLFYVSAFALLLVTAQAFAENREHTVQSGETAYTLARRYGVRPEEILFINGIEDARKIKVGQKLRIPESNTMAAPASAGSGEPAPLIVDYTAVNGDTLYGIARKYGITYQTLVDANNFSKDKKLKIGESIKVPVPASVQPAAVPDAPMSAALAAATGENALPVDKMVTPIGKNSPARIPAPPPPCQKQFGG